MIENELSESDIKKINKELLESLQNYRKTISFLAGDAPIEVLCLSKPIEKALISDGCLRVYDLFDRDLTKIKGIGKTRIRELTTSLNQFISVS